MIYFVQRGQFGPIKIGYTSKDDVRSRISNLQTANPETLMLLGIIEGDVEKEKSLHRLFSPCRISGEWFDATPKIFTYLLGLILGRELVDPPKSSLDITEWDGQLGLRQFLASQEQRIIKSALAWNKGNITKTAKDLGVTFRALRYSIEKYGIK